jgi:hypothetical protein
MPRDVRHYLKKQFIEDLKWLYSKNIQSNENILNISVRKLIAGFQTGHPL